MYVNDTNYQRQIIDTFINAIYVFDDKLVFTYNFHDGTETITLKEIEAAFGSDLSQVAPPQTLENTTFSRVFHFHRRGVYFFQGSPWRRERLEPPFRSHGRLAQLPENRGGFVGGIRKKGL
ncbi:MAG: hypothetical protein K5922_04125, partial [Clostridiales bacterium]|nr:hypothetical protein [Clostridiales bacterium]